MVVILAANHLECACSLCWVSKNSVHKNPARRLVSPGRDKPGSKFCHYVQSRTPKLSWTSGSTQHLETQHHNISKVSLEGSQCCPNCKPQDGLYIVIGLPVVMMSFSSLDPCYRLQLLCHYLNIPYWSRQYRGEPNWSTKWFFFTFFKRFCHAWSWIDSVIASYPRHLPNRPTPKSHRGQRQIGKDSWCCQLNATNCFWEVKV